MDIHFVLDPKKFGSHGLISESPLKYIISSKMILRKAFVTSTSSVVNVSQVNTWRNVLE